ncbi:MAG: NB-ARC domain-containing protein [Actinomycetota bacterium]|nr:NB-ARC domain-containing protein [Actinomycetota bacterium]
MSELPVGTVTLLFTDVEGSTRLLHEHGSGYAALLREHRRLLREVFRRHAGVEVDTQGDSFFVAFARASDAVAAATEAQRTLADGPLRVRIGVHTGEPIVTDEGYVGVDVHRAARVMSAAHGGQVVVSERTRSFVGDGQALIDLGLHRLKDLGQSERLYQIGAGDFPPLRTLDATNLPVAASPLLGRERELGELVAMLGDGTRLVTITGPGGTGKTRLALQVAAELVGTGLEAVYWVPLAGVSESELVLPEIAQTVGARDDLTEYLRGRQLLLVLDNLEHLPAAAPRLAELLSASSELRVLATSRAPLHLSGEREYFLEPLQPGDATTLFVERARATGRRLTPDATVDAICRRLDGLPLAIELAAARIRLLTPETLLERLDDALPLLTGGARDMPERQRTLRGTIEWSHDLLGDACRRLFASLAVFAGSFPLAAAEQVCDAVLDDLATLVDLSLVKSIGDDRFLMLETIRQYAAEQLAGSGEADERRRRHAEFFGRLAEEAYANRFVGEEEWSARLELDHDDLRAALDWLAERDADSELVLAGALGWFWLSHSHLAEGRRRLAGALARSQASGPARARALTLAGALAGWLGESEDAHGNLAKGVALWRGSGNAPELTSALDLQGWALFALGEDAKPLAAFEESLELRRELGDRPGELRALVGVCQLLVARGDVDRAEPLSHELLELSRGRDLRSQHFAHHFSADCALLRGDCEEAEARYRESLRAALPLGDVVETSFEVQGVGMAAAGRGEWTRGIRLAAAGEAVWESLGVKISVPFWDALLERYIGSARERLGAEADAVWAEGRELPFDDAVTLALESD